MQTENWLIEWQKEHYPNLEETIKAMRDAEPDPHRWDKLKYCKETEALWPVDSSPEALLQFVGSEPQYEWLQCQALMMAHKLVDLQGKFYNLQSHLETIKKLYPNPIYKHQCPEFDFLEIDEHDQSIICCSCFDQGQIDKRNDVARLHQRIAHLENTIRELNDHRRNTNQD